MGLQSWTLRLVCYLALALFSRGVASQKPPEQKRIEVDVAGAKARVFDRVMAAFVAEDLTAESANPDAGLIVAEPISVKAGGLGGALGVEAVAVIRATILGGDSTSKVVLSAGWRMTHGIAQAKRNADAEGPNKPVTSRDGGALKQVWQRLERIAEALAPAK